MDLRCFRIPRKGWHRDFALGFALYGKRRQLARIGLVSAASTGRAAGSAMPYRMLQGLRREQHSFSDISAWNFDSCHDAGQRRQAAAL